MTKKGVTLTTSFSDGLSKDMSIEATLKGNILQRTGPSSTAASPNSARLYVWEPRNPKIAGPCDRGAISERTQPAEEYGERNSSLIEEEIPL